MPLNLPQLDDRRWKDLLEESGALIPTLAPEWTNFNASDPGITLIELFAYLAETLLYRVNRVSEPSQRAFLRLINGPHWQPHGDLQGDIRSTLASLHHCRRAVTVRDFESLAMTVNDQPHTGEPHVTEPHVTEPHVTEPHVTEPHVTEPHVTEKVARAHCLPRRNLELGGAAQREAAGHVTVLILPTTRKQPSEELLRRVRSVLEPARLITTRVHVVAPRFFRVKVRAVLTVPKDAVPDNIRKNATAALKKFFDPLEGGPDGFGWPFGRGVYVSEIYRILARLPGVVSVNRSVDPVTNKPLDELVVGAADATRLIRNRLGELEAVELQQDELVGPDPDMADLDVKQR